MKISQQNKTFFMGNTPFGNQGMDVKDRIAMKKQLYQKEAMKIVSAANKSEKTIDGSLEERRGRIQELAAKNEEANANYVNARNQMLKAKEDYEIGDNDQEQKDLELLQKKYESEKPGSKVVLTEEEEKRLEAMGEPTEYQKYAMDFYKQADVWKTEMEENQKQINGESAVIRSIKIERLKQHGMVDAMEAKEKMMEAASKEAVAMMVEDAKKTVDDKAEEVKEEAEERTEKKEEQEERIEAAKENRAEAEAATEAVRENISDLTEQMTDSEEIMQDIDEEIKKVMQEEKLLEEDIKGLAMNVTA